VGIGGLHRSRSSVSSCYSIFRLVMGALIQGLILAQRDKPFWNILERKPGAQLHRPYLLDNLTFHHPTTPLTHISLTKPTSTNFSIGTSI
jgi:hypothetical protein